MFARCHHRPGGVQTEDCYIAVGEGEPIDSPETELAELKTKRRLDELSVPPPVSLAAATVDAMANQRDDGAALRHFERLLAKHSSEVEFQRLFARYPRILSLSLPLRLQPTNLMPLARPGRSEPDFLISPDERGAFGWGVIELKRPDQRIFSLRARKGLIVLSRTAAIAVAQTQQYLRGVSSLEQPHGAAIESLQHSLVVGNSRYAFVIMGLSDEVLQATATDVLHQQIEGLLPANCQIIPYDVLCAWFRSSVPPEVFVLAPVPVTERGDEQLSLDEVLYDPEYWRVSDRSIDFWSEMAETARGLGATAVPDMRRSGWEVRDGALAGSLDTVTEANEALAIKVIELLRSLHKAVPSDERRVALERFLSACDLVLATGGHLTGRSDQLSQRQESLLAAAMAYVESERQSTAPLDPNDKDVEFLTDSGLVRFEPSDASSQYNIHPLMIWFGSVRWSPWRHDPHASRPRVPELRGSRSDSSIDDDPGGVAIFRFPSSAAAERFARWILRNHPNLDARVDKRVAGVVINNYATADQFERLAIRQVTTGDFEAVR